MVPFYNSWLVGLSIIVAMLVSYTALRLASRVAIGERRHARWWLVTGAVAMGVGIWTMHFIGMLAFSLPVPLAYRIPTTVGSLLVAIVTSGFALSISSGAELTLRRLSGAAVLMGSGIACMHYIGMAAIAIVPRIAYDPVGVIPCIMSCQHVDGPRQSVMQDQAPHTAQEEQQRGLHPLQELRGEAGPQRSARGSCGI